MNNTQLIVIDYDDNHNKVQVGDVVSTTTSSFDYNGVTDSFDNAVNNSVTVKAVKIGDDYTDYDVDKCRTGGQYGFDYYRVLAIIG